VFVFHFITVTHCKPQLKVAVLSSSTAAAEFLEAKWKTNAMHVKFKEENRSGTIYTICVENRSHTNIVKTSSCFRFSEALCHKTGGSRFNPQ
jgi:hypothetical protein